MPDISDIPDLPDIWYAWYAWYVEIFNDGGIIFQYNPYGLYE